MYLYLQVTRNYGTHIQFIFWLKVVFSVTVGCVFCRFYVALTIFQSYHGCLEAGDTQSLTSKWRILGSNPKPFALQDSSLTIVTEYYCTTAALCAEGKKEYKTILTGILCTFYGSLTFSSRQKKFCTEKKENTRLPRKNSTKH